MCARSACLRAKPAHARRVQRHAPREIFGNSDALRLILVHSEPIYPHSTEVAFSSVYETSLSVSVACCDEWGSVLAVSKASGVCGDSLSDSGFAGQTRIRS